jgi:hypothetical protein
MKRSSMLSWLALAAVTLFGITATSFYGQDQQHSLEFP